MHYIPLGLKFTLMVAIAGSPIVSAKQHDGSFVYVDFDIAMSNHLTPGKRSSRLDYSSNLKLIKICKKLYTTYNPQRMQAALSQPLKIPKIIHQIWLGGPVPEKYTNYRQSWIDHHPDWEYRLWTDADVESFQLQNKELFDKARNYGEKADIFRYEILHRYGGLYVDIDFECLKPFDALHHFYDFYAGFEQEGRHMELCNAIIGTSPGNAIIKLCNKSLKEEGDYNDVLSTIKRTGPYYFTECFMKAIQNYKGKALILPVSFLYPVPIKPKVYVTLESVKQWIRPETLAVHYWAAGWTKSPKLSNFYEEHL